MGTLSAFHFWMKSWGFLQGGSNACFKLSMSPSPTARSPPKRGDGNKEKQRKRGNMREGQGYQTSLGGRDYLFNLQIKNLNTCGFYLLAFLCTESPAHGCKGEPRDRCWLLLPTGWFVSYWPKTRGFIHSWWEPFSCWYLVGKGSPGCHGNDCHL